MIDTWWVLAQIVAGALGALARFGVMTIVRPGVWSWGLFVVNGAGSLAVGAAAGAFAVQALDWTIASLVLAFAAGLTTFSTLTVTAAQHIERREIRIGSIMVTSHVVVGIVVAALGYISTLVLLGS
ncbi:MAG: CrcB family protein [Microbacteriaceae bacterium]|nr:CrcB family protein [Microbacteriaceae bacterium]